MRDIGYVIPYPEGWMDKYMYKQAMANVMECLQRHMDTHGMHECKDMCSWVMSWMCQVYH